MKRTALALAVLFATSLIQAQSQPAAKADPAAATAAKPADTKAATKKDAKKKEAEPKIPGVNIARANGTYLGLELTGGKFKLSFYDKKKKPAKIDVTRAIARWPNTRSSVKAFNRTVLNPAGGNALISVNPVVPPIIGSVYIMLMDGEGDEAKVLESFSVQM